jgi:hypothetical protein
LLKPLTPALEPIKSVFDFLILWAFHIGDENHIRHRQQSWYIHLHLPFFSIWDLRSNRNLHLERVLLARLGDVIAVIIKSTVSWNLTPCYLVSRQTLEKPTSTALHIKYGGNCRFLRNVHKWRSVSTASDPR